MKDLEAKLRSLSFREPPPGLRGAVLAAVKSRGWQSWLAPHPAAWGALAALWLMLAVLDVVLNGPIDTAQERSNLAQVQMRQTPVLLAFYRQSSALESGF